MGLEDINEDKGRHPLPYDQQAIAAVGGGGGGMHLEGIALENRFGKPYFTLDGVSCGLSQWDDLKERSLNITSKITAPDLTYLNLDVSLSWLHPLAPETKAEMEPPHQVQQSSQKHSTN